VYVRGKADHRSAFVIDDRSSLNSYSGTLPPARNTALPRHHADPRRRARTRFCANDDFDVLIQRVEQRHQPLHRETFKPGVAQRRDLGLVEAEPRRGCGLREVLRIQDRFERGSKPELNASAMGVETALRMCHLMCGGSHMATNLSSNPELFERALEVSGERTRKAAVTKALQESNSSVLPGST
jgi:hypothetical protein